MARKTDKDSINNSVNSWCGAEDHAQGLKSVNLKEGRDQKTAMLGTFHTVFTFLSPIISANNICTYFGKIC